MRTLIATLTVAGALAGAAHAHETYLDPFGLSSDVDPFFLSQGFAHLDLAAVEVDNHDQGIHFNILVDADISSATGTDWGKFLVFIDVDGGVSGRSDNPWGRNIVSSNSADYFIGGWADGGGGAELYRATSTGWELTMTAGGHMSPFHVRLTNASAGVFHVGLPEAAIGSPAYGSDIFIDVATTGGGGTDPGVDHLSLSSIATPNWQTGSGSGPFLTYHVEPAPGTVAVIGLGGMLASRRRRTT